MSCPASTDALPRFWRDPALPFIEARSVADGRKVCYAPHAHATFSVGAVIAGSCDYVNGIQRQRISQGCVVMMNPQVVHACNPVEGQPWSYVMLYIDPQWLGALQHTLGMSAGGTFVPFASILSPAPELFSGVTGLYACLIDPLLANAIKQEKVRAFFTALQGHLAAAPVDEEPLQALRRAAAFIQRHCTEALTLDDISAEAGVSSSYLIRAFKRHFGLTPHAYLVNRRIQHSQRALREGRSLSDVALEAGFADQAHFQRTFKRHLAATPGQYRD
ncbi:helix-turn-helix transcriptional regulator [Stutzerimonas azotifigens]|uniref:AraC family transcriptional regulator n=1 Tax=Stutzerimonas azotifigens TaxID=291995 RepID=A0ABR5YWV3_9GAMM|nr:AraC family transcriptional regulator [Stutzerimonas azotifigens]MBA1272412.1 AraC family transcriptional regulator [Stutzerimonas azotifigens]